MIIHDSASESTLIANQNPVPEDASLDDWEVTLPAWVGGRQPTDADKAAALFPLNPFKYIRMVGYDKSSSKKDTVTGTSPPSFAELEQHLSCIDALGSIGYLPGWEEETTVGCVDIDNKNNKTAEAFQEETGAIQAALKRHGVAFNLERSTNGGHHLWVFLTESVPYDVLRSALRFVVDNAGEKRYSKTEVFPKGNANSNAIFLPYRGASVEGNNGLGRTYLEQPDGTPIPLSRVLDEVRVTDARRIRKLATKTNARASATPAPRSSHDLDPAGLSLLKAAALTLPTNGFRRHDSAEGFLNLAERMGKQDEMLDFLTSDAVFSLWITDGSRGDTDVWRAELERWVNAHSEREFGIPELEKMGWNIPELPKLEMTAPSGGKLNQQEAFSALERKYAPGTTAIGGNSDELLDFGFDNLDDIPVAEPLVHDVLMKRSLCALIGKSGAGKSMIALDIAFHVALGEPWRGRKVERGAVAWVAAEADAETADRMAAWREFNKRSPKELANFRGLKAPSLPLTDVAPNGGLERLILNLKRIEAKTGKLELIVIDTVSRTYGAGLSENDNTDMVFYTNCAELLTRVFDATVWLLHHEGRGSTGKARGASSFDAPMESVTAIEKKAGYFQLRTDKMRSGSGLLEPVDIRLVSREIKRCGKVRSVGVVDHAAIGTSIVFSPEMLHEKQRAVYEALEDLSASEAFGEAPKPVKRAEWVALCKERGLSESTIKDSIRYLLKHKHVLVSGKGNPSNGPYIIEAAQVEA